GDDGTATTRTVSRMARARLRRVLFGCERERSGGNRSTPGPCRAPLRAGRSPGKTAQPSNIPRRYLSSRNPRVLSLPKRRQAQSAGIRFRTGREFQVLFGFEESPWVDDFFRRTSSASDGVSG